MQFGKCAAIFNCVCIRSIFAVVEDGDYGLWWDVGRVHCCAAQYPYVAVAQRAVAQT
jgi:hypothetical protein